jgi:hypothetical protein
MPITKGLTIENVNLDDEREMDALVNQIFTSGLQRVRAEATNCAGGASSIQTAIFW